MSKIYKCGPGCDFTTTTKIAFLSHQKGSKCTRLASEEDIKTQYHEKFLSIAMKAVGEVLSDETLEALRTANVDVVDYKVYAARYQQLKDVFFPWRDKDELMAELCEQPGIYREHWLEAEALRVNLFQKKSPIDDKLHRPHTDYEWVKAYHEMAGTPKDSSAGKLRKAVDHAWSMAYAELKNEVDIMFKGRPDMAKAVLTINKLFDSVPEKNTK